MAGCAAARTRHHHVLFVAVPDPDEERIHGASLLSVSALSMGRTIDSRKRREDRVACYGFWPQGKITLPDFAENVKMAILEYCNESSILTRFRRMTQTTFGRLLNYSMSIPCVEAYANRTESRRRRQTLMHCWQVSAAVLVVQVLVQFLRAAPWRFL